MRKLCFIFGILFFKALSAQTMFNTENTWLIDYYVKDKQLNKQISDINQLTLVGKYTDAKSVISQIKNKINHSALEYAYTLCYEASILYNESQYNKSIELSDSSLYILSNHDNNNRYIIKSQYTKAKALAAINKYSDAFNLIYATIQKAQVIKDTNGLAKSYYLLASVFSDKGDYVKSEELLKKSIALQLIIKDELALSASYSFLGLTNTHLGKYMDGIELIHKSITIREKYNDKRGLANSYLTLYKIYIDIGEADKAIQSELKSLEICKEINDLQCISGRFTNLGAIYQTKGNYQIAMTYHLLALNISKQINIKNRVADVYENIAKNYLFNHQYNTASLYIDSCINIRKQIGDKEGLISAAITKSHIALDNNQIETAIKEANDAWLKAEKLNLSYLVKDAHYILSNSYQRANNYKEAFKHYNSFISYRDSLYNIDKSKEIVRKELEYNFHKKEVQQKLEASQKIEEQKQKSKRQKIIILGSVIGIIILSSLLIFGFIQYKQKIKSEKKLQTLNTHLNSQNQLLEEKSHIIEAQNATIQLKNNEITDSIKYAQKIQSAIMPLKEEYIKNFDDCFVFFEPKDIISGDFYWVTQRNDKIIFATGDCTGHGVPGGFMSMLGVSLLNEIINEHDLTEPALILSRLRKKVITALRQKGLAGEQQDGMDMIVCVLDKKENTLHYASANQVLYIISENNKTFTLNEYKGDKQPVGIFGKELRPFKQHMIQLEKGDSVYTFTDGFTDQFGGPKGKKYKHKQLKEFLLSIQHLSFTEQEKIVHQNFSNWKGVLEQVDDVTLIGIKIS